VPTANAAVDHSVKISGESVARGQVCPECIRSPKFPLASTRCGDFSLAL
jgi:hypothetical protein